MLSQFFNIFIGTLIITIINNFYLLFVTSIFIDQKVSFHKIRGRFVFASFILAGLLSSISFQNIYTGTHQLTTLTTTLMNCLQIIGCYVILNNNFQQLDFFDSLFIQSLTMSWGCASFLEYLTISLVYKNIQNLPDIFMILTPIIITLVTNIILSLIIFIFRKSYVMLAIKHLFSYRSFIIIFSGLILISDSLTYYFFSYQNNNREFNYFILSIIYLILLIIFSLWAFAKDRNTQLKHTEFMLTQQQRHLLEMENIQQKLRSIQHDYKNMLASIYLHASEGNTKEIQDFLSQNLFQLDYQIEEKIKQQNQLLHVNNMEIKGLLITKLIEAESKNLSIHLEIINTIDSFYIQTNDLVRILGVFIDNAIEATMLASSDSIYLSMLEDEDRLSILIKNPTAEKINISDLKQNGFSTKGKNRGIGLANVQSILSEYPNVLNKTSIKNNEFTQLLTIQK